MALGRRISGVADRLTRVNSAIREVVGAAVTELADPRIGFVTITSARVARDFSSVEVGFSVLGDESQRQRTMDALRSARGLLQREIAREVRLRQTPQITFVYDDTTDTAMRITELLEHGDATASAGDGAGGGSA